MRAGTLRTRIEIQRKSDSGSVDAANRPVLTWSSIRNAYADVVPLSGGELEQARSIIGTASHRITIRQRDFAPNLSDRVYVPGNGKTLQIGAVLEDQRGRDMVLLCGEVVAT